MCMIWWISHSEEEDQHKIWDVDIFIRVWISAGCSLYNTWWHPICISRTKLHYSLRTLTWHPACSSWESWTESEELEQKQENGSKIILVAGNGDGSTICFLLRKRYKCAPQANFEINNTIDSRSIVRSWRTNAVFSLVFSCTRFQGDYMV